MIWIGIIAWFLFIWILDCSMNPLFIWLSIVVGVFCTVCVVYSWWRNRPAAAKRHTKTILKPEREKAIDEWEKKWGRKHPSRKCQ